MTYCSSLGQLPKLKSQRNLVRSTLSDFQINTRDRDFGSISAAEATNRGTSKCHIGCIAQLRSEKIKSKLSRSFQDVKHFHEHSPIISKPVIFNYTGNEPWCSRGSESWSKKIVLRGWVPPNIGAVVHNHTATVVHGIAAMLPCVCIIFMKSSNGETKLARPWEEVYQHKLGTKHKYSIWPTGSQAWLVIHFYSILLDFIIFRNSKHTKIDIHRIFRTPYRVQVTIPDSLGIGDAVYLDWWRCSYFFWCSEAVDGSRNIFAGWVEQDIRSLRYRKGDLLPKPVSLVTPRIICKIKLW